MEQQLVELESLRSRGIVTEEEYQQRRQMLLVGAPAVSAAPTSTPGGPNFPVTAQAKGGPGFFKIAGIGCGVLVLGVVILVVLAAALAGSGDDDSSSSTSVGTNKGDVHVPLAVGSSGEVAPDGNPNKKTKITILAVQDDAKSTNQFSQPPAGKKYWTMQVEVQNVGTEETTSVDWKLRDSKDNELDDTFTAGLGEMLDPVYQLTPGGKKTGLIVFTLDQDASPKWVRADPNPFLKNDLYFDAVQQ